MNRRYRKTIIAGNWKMNKTPSEARQLIDELKPLISKAKWCEVVLCVPYVDIPVALRALKDSRIAVGAQNMHHEESGAYTGDVSASMLKDLGVKYVIIGHSERRAYYHETDTLVNQKVHLALKTGLRPIVCVGETLEQRDQGVTLDLITVQVKAALSGVSAEKLRQIVFAYEPIWAIGTGRTATSEQAGEVGASIRTTIRKMYGARAARSVTIQYGGSMNAANAHDLLAQLDVDGGLIGGASLKAADFAAIVQAANQ
ncbi:MAG: triose-phosphate isomerase [Oscillospiraceae bacterium]|jgi:triosephosphate isomerase|nr:triose-phosphate isomerase [Oscillospiraceae bacterium]